jgi:hypothetical protein
LITHKTKHSDITIKEDRYPYTESIDILNTLTDWWSDPKLSNNIDLSNYSLDNTIPNSIASSFRDKLVDGNFTFVYLNDQVLAYAGLQRGDQSSSQNSPDVRDTAWIHRLCGNPKLFSKNLGTGTDIIMPFQIKTAIELGCRYYNFTMTEARYKWYLGLKNETFLKSRRLKYTEGMKLLTKFDFKGKEIRNWTEQYIISLDLSRPDINDFIIF